MKTHFLYYRFLHNFDKRVAKFMPDTHFNLFYDEIYSSGLDPSARFPVSRYSKLRKRLLELDEKKIIGWLYGISFIRADDNMAGAVFFLNGSKITLYFLILYFERYFFTKFK